MIAQIQGKVIQTKDSCIILETQGFCYEVLIPAIIMSRLQEFIEDGQLKLITYHYHQVEPSKSIPVLIGFINEIEKEFFELFITVSGIGPKAALRALNKPISSIAKWINDADASSLCSLPGIGKQKAKEIIAKLQGKMAKFGLIQDSQTEVKTQVTDDIKLEALEILLQLQYRKQEAQEMINKVLNRCPDIKNTQELLNEVYRQRIK